MDDFENLVWIDMEFTGLDAENDRVLEIATIITDSGLNVLAEGPVIAVHQQDAVLEGMDEWNTTHHTESGLVERCRKSMYDEEKAEKETLDFIRQHCEESRALLCGNSVHMDRWFMKVHMPELEAYLSYRNIDVSSIKELVNRWMPEIPEFEKENTHRALEDIRESIGELMHYKQSVFDKARPPGLY